MVHLHFYISDGGGFYRTCFYLDSCNLFRQPVQQLVLTASSQNVQGGYRMRQQSVQLHNTFPVSVG